MAEISGFSALRYDLGKAGPIETLVCPPYDIISEDQRQDLLDKNPYNMVRLELPQGEDPYAQAAGTLSAWRESGVLRRDMEPGMYLYEMEFLDRVDRGERRTLRGLLCRVRLEEFSAGVVLPHEETLSKAKEDRYQLMRATGCNFSPIYALYPDQAHVTRQRLDRLAGTCAPRYDFSDGPVAHRLWVINDPVAMDALREDFADRKLYIADGHHRYETALRYRDALRAENRYCPGADSVMMLLADMEDPGLVVFPTHRLVRGLAAFDGPALMGACETWFDIAVWPDRAAAENALAAAYEAGRHAFVFFDGKGPHPWHTLTLRDESVMDGLLPDKSQASRRLDVAILHSLVLEKLLGIDRENMAAQRNLTYTRSPEEAEASVLAGESDCLFLLNPTRVSEIGAVARAGEKMPQKSTYFYPKVITGLAINPLEE